MRDFITKSADRLASAVGGREEIVGWIGWTEASVGDTVADYRYLAYVYEWRAATLFARYVGGP